MNSFFLVATAALITIATCADAQTAAQAQALKEATRTAKGIREMTGAKPVAKCWIPCDHLPIRSWPLFRARDVMRGVIESFQEACAA